MATDWDTWTASLPGIETDVRIMRRLLDEAARVSPGTPRVELVRRFAGSRNFEERMIADRVAPRRMADATDQNIEYLGLID